MAKRVLLIGKYFMDITELNMTLKSNSRMVTNEAGEEREVYDEHGHFTDDKSIFGKLHKLLKMEKMSNNTTISLIEYKKMIDDTNEQIDKLCRLLEEGYKECSVKFVSGNFIEHSENDE